MKIGEIIDVEKIVCRDVDVNGLYRLLTANRPAFFSWGANKFVNLYDKGLRFKVNGYKHKGLVYIVLNGADLFDVYYTNRNGKIVDTDEGLYFDMLVDAIDERVEKQTEYKF